MSLRRLSVVDTGWPGHMPALVPALDLAGYHRYWTTEHYHPSQSASPALLAASAARLTTRMRIGTAGVLLNLTRPLHVVNDFLLLELLHPGRIDMGVAGAVGGDVVSEAMQATGEGYADRLRELATLRRLTSWHNGDPRAEVIGPRPTSMPPPLWICGTGLRSAELAGRLGAAYAFHDQLRSPTTDGPSVVAAYREAFRPSTFRSDPEVVVACTGAVAPSEAAAVAQLAALGIERSSFAGAPDQARNQLEELAAAHGVDELAIYLVDSDVEAKIDGYRALIGSG